jgi:hypothetical protein
MVGEDGGFIYVGTLDNGSWTWAKTSPKTNGESGHWVALTLSRDGSTAAAVDLGGDVYIGTSTDNWANGKWTGGQLKQDWWGVAISADGGKAVAVGGRGAFYVWSQDGRWTIPTPQTTVVDADWNHVACSQDCSTIVVAEDGGPIQTSTNGGAWQQRIAAGNHGWYYVASSTDGVRLAAVANGDKIYFSLNGGDTWTPAEKPGVNSWWSVTCSADCTKIVAVGADLIWTSIAGTTPGAQGSISGGPSDSIELEYLGSDVWRVVNPMGSPTIQIQ